MKNLILIRHSKSSWDSPVNDIERPLDQRGVKDAHLVSLNILDLLSKTFIVYSSTAKRACDTALIFSQNIHFPFESIFFKEQLYTFDVNQLEEIIKSFNKSAESVILFGHNAAITDFVNKFGDVLIENVPTTGCVSITFDIDCWKKIKNGKINRIVTPKYLK